MAAYLIGLDIYNYSGFKLVSTQWKTSVAFGWETHELDRTIDRGQYVQIMLGPPAVTLSGYLTLQCVEYLGRPIQDGSNLYIGCSCPSIHTCKLGVGTEDGYKTWNEHMKDNDYRPFEERLSIGMEKIDIMAYCACSYLKIENGPSSIDIGMNKSVVVLTQNKYIE